MFNAAFPYCLYLWGGSWIHFFVLVLTLISVLVDFKVEMYEQSKEGSLG